MRSIPMTMTWELLTRGRWSLLAFALAANLMPAMLITGLRLSGALESDNPSMLVMQVVLVQINMLVFGCALFDALGQPSRLYAMPIPTTSLVAWQMLPAMAVMALESLASTAWLNAVFGLGWPLWGPALFAAVGVVAIQTALWSTEKSAWMPLAIALPAALLGFWYKSRFGSPFSMPTHPWDNVTPSEILSLLAFAGLSYWLAVVGVARRRCGEPLPSLGIVAWFERVLDPPPDVGAPFAATVQAQFWYEWRRKGWAMPFTVVLGMAFGLGIWVLFVRELKDLFEGFVTGGVMLSLMGFMGLFLGMVGPNDQTFEMGHFLATRPLTNIEYSRTILKVLAKSVLIAWGIWAVPFLILLAVLSANHAVPSVEILSDLGAWYFPATLLGSWTITAVMASMSMTGRSNLLAQVVVGSLAFFIGLGVFAKYALPKSSHLPFARGVAVVIGMAIVLGAVSAFVAARRRALIGMPTAAASLGVWVVLSGLIAFDWTRHPERPLSQVVLFTGLASLVVAPLATAPLALAWNRNR